MTVQSTPKYLPEEWEASNRINFTDAEQQRAAAERLRAEAERLRKETHASTIKTQQSTGHKFSQRIKDIDFWKQELETKIGENTKETKTLLLEKKKLEDALTDTHFPLKVANECLQFRLQREKIELVHDAVEVQLIKVHLCQYNIMCVCLINKLKYFGMHHKLLHNLLCRKWRFWKEYRPSFRKYMIRQWNKLGKIICVYSDMYLHHGEGPAPPSNPR